MPVISSQPSLLRPRVAGEVGLSDLGVLHRVLAMALRYRTAMTIALLTTIVAAGFQLLIPRYLGHAVDSAQGLLGGGDEAAARAALWQLGRPAARRVGAARPVHDVAQLPGRGDRPAGRLRSAHGLLRPAAAAELRLPRPGPHGRADHPRHARHRGHPDGDQRRRDPPGAGRDPGRRRRVPAAAPGAAARPDRAELRAVRRLALGGGAAAAARELAGAAGEARRADPGDGGEPRRHPGGPRLRGAAL